MKIYKANISAIKKIIKNFPDDEMKDWTEKEQIEYLANVYIQNYIKMVFTNGKDYFRN